MKKALVYLAFSILILGLIISYDVTQCDGQVIMRHFIKTDYEPQYEVPVYAVVEEIPTPTPKPEPTKVIEVSEEAIEELEDEEIVEEKVEEVPQEVDSHADEDASRGYEYYFGFLNDKERQVYRSMYKAFKDVGSGNTIPTVDDEAMNRVAGYIRLDHPEFYYIKDMGYTHYTLGGQIQKTVLAANYTDSKTVIAMETESMEEIARKVEAAIPVGADDYAKVKYVYEWIIFNTEYDTSAPDNQNIKSVLLGSKSVCAGYARTMQYLLNKLGVDTTVVEGKSLVTGENHAWNLVNINGNYYYVDPTWGDASYKGNDYDANQYKINYDYLLVTTEELSRTHVTASDLPVPMCTATDDNYYVREGLMLYGYDSGVLYNIFENAYANNQSFVTFKCANLEIYDEVRNVLVKQNGVFNYLHGDAATISYVDNEEQRTLCFWL